jgi:hypothetical protein
VVLLGAFEKVVFPTAILLMLIFQWWEALLITIGAETLITSLVLLFVAREPQTNRFEKSTWRGIGYFLKSIILTPLRYLSLLFDLITILIFVVQLWFFKDRRWRK